MFAQFQIKTYFNQFSKTFSFYQNLISAELTKYLINKNHEKKPINPGCQCLNSYVEAHELIPNYYIDSISR